MRPFLVFILTFACLGTVWSYSRISKWLSPPPPELITEAAQGHFSLQIQLSFDQASSAEENLVVVLNGKTIHHSNLKLTASTLTELETVPVTGGENHLHVSVKSPVLSKAQRQKNAESFLLDNVDTTLSPHFQCCRVQVFRDGIRIPGGDLTAHADGKSVIIIDGKFSVAITKGPGHQH